MNRNIIVMSIFLSIVLLSGLVSAEMYDTKLEDEIYDSFENKSLISVTVLLDESESTKYEPKSFGKNAKVYSTRVSEFEVMENSILSTLDDSDFQLEHKYKIFNGFSGNITKEGFEKLRKDPRVVSIETNEVSGGGHTFQSLPIIHADKVHDSIGERTSLSGDGQVICVIDTGVDYGHPNLGDCDTETFLNGTCEKVIGGRDVDNRDDDPMDENWHGTFVTGILAAEGHPTYRSVAPDSKIVAVKALDENNRFENLGVITRAIEWCVDNSEDLEIDIISMSIGTDDMYTSACDGRVGAWNRAVEAAVDNGIAVVASSGNEHRTNAMAAPACIREVISVGSVFDNGDNIDEVTDETNRPDFLEVLAPGEDITSTRAGGGWAVAHGTSFAAPHVSGSIALINEYLEENDIDADIDEIREVLAETGRDVTSDGNTFPRIDVYKAIYSHFHKMKVGDTLDAFVYDNDIWRSNLTITGEDKIKVSIDWDTDDELKLSLISPDGSFRQEIENPRLEDGLVALDPMNGDWLIEIYGTEVEDEVAFEIITKKLSKNMNDTDESGIDFTDLNLNYISTCSEQDEGFVFALKGEEAGSGDVILNLSEERNHAVNDFMTGLVIPDHEQWITMDIVPDGSGGYKGSVERIDETFRETETARVMLDADVKLKFDQFASSEQKKLDKEMAQYWIDDIKGGPYWSYLNSKGFNSVPHTILRTWIHPEYFEVNGTDCYIFIENSKMDVSVTMDAVSLPGLDSYGLNEEAEEYLFGRMMNFRDEYISRHRERITPVTKDLVNNHPKYQDLRSAYASLAIAQWYKDGDRRNIPFGDNINSKNITGLYSSPSFNIDYWNEQAWQYLYSQSAPCGFHGETCDWTWRGGVMLSSIPPEVIGNLSDEMNEIINRAMVDEYATDGDDYYIGSTIEIDGPDLKSNAIWFSETKPSTEDTFNINAMIRNDGNENSGSFKTHIYDEYTYPNGYKKMELISTKTITNIASDESTKIEISMNSDLIGEHRIHVLIDPYSRVKETNEFNNFILKNITILSAYPTVEINNPLDGQMFSYGEEIEFFGMGIDPQDGMLVNDSIVWESSLDGAIGNGESLKIDSLSEGTHIITLTAEDYENHSTSEQIGIVIRPAGYPSSRIESPRTELFAEGAVIYFKGYASDQEDGELTGDSLVWESDTDDSIGNGTSFEINDLSVGKHVISLTSIDSSGFTTTSNIEIEIEEGTPIVSIDNPKNNTQAFFGYPVIFNCTASDPQDGVLTNNSIVWESNIDGFIGTDKILNISSLSEGTHIIKVIVTDSHGLQKTDSLMITVNPAGYPIASLLNPRNGESFVHSYPVELIGTSLDAEDGELTGDSLVWISSIDGDVGTSENLTTSSLSIGEHLMKLKTTNSNGKSTYLYFNIIITSKPPEITISNPESGKIFRKDDTVSFSGYADDLEDGSIPASSLKWSSSLDGELYTGSSFSVSTLSVGTHEIKLSATDSHNVTNETIANIVIAAAGEIKTNIFNDGATVKNLKFPTGGRNETVYLKIIRPATVKVAELDITGKENNDKSTSSTLTTESEEEAPEIEIPKIIEGKGSDNGFDSDSNETLEKIIETDFDITGGSSCTQSGYAYCYEHIESYGPATAHARAAMNTPWSRGDYQNVKIDGVWRTYFVKEFKIDNYCKGDKASYKITGSWPSCDGSGCSGTSISKTGSFSIANAPKKGIPEAYYQCWDYDYRSGYWSTAWAGWGVGDHDNVYVLNCGKDSDCDTGEICDKTSTWDEWECIVPNKPKNPKMDATTDGDFEWSYSGYYLEKQTTDDFSDEIQKYTDDVCTESVCLVPITFYSEDRGTLEISNIDFQYEIHDTEAPEIISVDITPNPVEAGKTITIKVDAEDNVQIENVTIKLDDTDYILTYNNTSELYETSVSTPTAGIYDVLIKVKDFVSLEATAIEKLETYSLEPELSLDSNLSYTPNAPETGNVVKVNTTVYNYGDGLAEDFIVTLKVDDVNVDNKTISLTGTSNTSLELRWNALQGSHELKVVVDSGDKISEYDESNNDATRSIYVLDTEPPVIHSFNYTESVYVGDNIIISANVSDNVGVDTVKIMLDSTYDIKYNPSSGLYEGIISPSTAGKYPISLVVTDIDGLTTSKSGSVNVYGIEPDLKINPSDIITGEISAGISKTISLNVHNMGKTKAENVTVLIDVGRHTIENKIDVGLDSYTTTEFNWTANYGVQTIKISLDPENNINETDKTNNNASKSIFAYDVTAPIINSVYYLPEIIHEGDDVSLSVDITDNVGIKEAKVLLKSEEVMLTLDGSVYKGTITAPSEGDYLLEITAIDTSNLQSILKTPIKVHSNAADISIDEVYINPKVLSDLKEGTFNVSLSNNGNSDADNFIVELLIDGFKVDSEEVSIEKSKSDTVKLKWNATYGNHNIKIKADSTGKIFESNESNNNYEKLISVVDITAPPAPIVNADPSDWASDKQHTISWSPVLDVNGIDHYEYMINYGDWIEVTSPFETPAQSEGIHIVYVRAVDNAGNLGEIGNTTLYIDDSIPNTPEIYESHSGTKLTEHYSPYYSWSNPGDTGSGIEYYVGE
ncbi:MAG: S8 family serine peptidase, partial [Candidatus Aenigmarchaeota archaeon]|nr:S8 family serine peptidase [Candidatus Aenigmarchaeota archaeon]